MDYSKNNFESFDSSYDKNCVGNGIFFYFNDDGNLDLYYIVKYIYPVININSSIIFVEYTGMNWIASRVNGLCI